MNKYVNFRICRCIKEYLIQDESSIMPSRRFIKGDLYEFYNDSDYINEDTRHYIDENRITVYFNKSSSFVFSNIDKRYNGYFHSYFVDIIKDRNDKINSIFHDG